MNTVTRRGFLKGLVGAAAIAATPALAEALLPKRTIMLPPKGGWPVIDPSVHRYVHRTYTLGRAYTAEPLAPGEYQKLAKRYTDALVESMRETTERVTADLYSGDFEVERLRYENRQLFSNAFEEPAALSEKALEDMLVKIHNWTDERGIRIQPPKYLLRG